MSTLDGERIFVSGHRGMVGGALLRGLEAHGVRGMITRTRQELDLCDASAVDAFYRDAQPTMVIVAAARVGGIHANSTYPAEFMHENLAIAHNLIHGGWQHGIRRLLFLGSSCIYPRDAEQPMREDCLLSGPLESTNEAYALAKICGLKLCEYYRREYGVLYHSAMPTNLYGPGDNYHPEHSHVLPALLRRFHEAREQGADRVTLWGSGTPRREFMHVDDLTAGLLHLLQLADPPDWVNVGCGSDVTIRELGEMVARVVGYRGEIAFDTSRPDGTPRKLMDSQRIFATGWRPTIELEAGIRDAYRDFLARLAAGTLRAV